MFQECKFDKKKDLQEHVPSLAIDFAKCIESGTIPPTADPQEFNNMEIETAENGVRLREPFDALEYEQKLAAASIEFKSGTGNNPTPIVTPVAESTVE